MSAPSSPSPLRQSFSQLRGHDKPSPRPEGVDSTSGLHQQTSSLGLDGEAAYPDTTGDQSIIAPPELRPYFTLVEDTATGEHTHPIVHYIFSDDDPDTVTSSVLDTMDQGTNQRLLLLDVSADAKTVVSAHSLDHKWQVHQAAFSQAPSWNNDTGPTQMTEGLMLRIQGSELETGPAVSVGEHLHADAIDSMRATLGNFNQGLVRLEEMLQGVVAEPLKDVHSSAEAHGQHL